MHADDGEVSSPNKQLKLAELSLSSGSFSLPVFNLIDESSTS